MEDAAARQTPDQSVSVLKMASVIPMEAMQVSASGGKTLHEQGDQIHFQPDLAVPNPQIQREEHPAPIVGVPLDLMNRGQSAGKIVEGEHPGCKGENPEDWVQSDDKGSKKSPTPDQFVCINCLGQSGTSRLPLCIFRDGTNSLLSSR